MKNKVVVFSKNLSCIDKVKEELSKRGQFDFSIQFCTFFDECLASCKEAKESSEKTIVVCKNEVIDKILAEIATKEDNLSLLFQQAVQLCHEDKNMLFVPSEIEFPKFFDVFLQTKKAFCFSVFGKTANFVESRMDTLDLGYEIITKSQFLHTIRISEPLDETWLQDNFENVILSDDLGKICREILQEKGLTLAMAEQITMGRVLGEIGQNENLKKGEILLSVNDFMSAGVKEETLQNFGIVSKEVAFEVCKRNLNSADISLSILGDETGKTMLAMGDKSQIHVFSSVFQNQDGAVLDEMRDFALFKLFCFLNSNKENKEEKE